MRHVVAEHDAVLVAVARSAAHQPHVRQLRVRLDDEVIVDAVFALTDPAVDQRLLRQRRKPFVGERASLAELVGGQRMLLGIGIDELALEGRHHLEPAAFDARKSVGVVDRPGRKIRIREAVVAGRRAVKEHRAARRGELVLHHRGEDLRQPRTAREDEGLRRDAPAGRERDVLQRAARARPELHFGGDEPPARLLERLRHCDAAFARLQHAGARRRHHDLDVARVELRVLPRQIVVRQYVVFDAEPIEHLPGLGHLLCPGRGHRQLAGPVEQLLAPFRFPRLPAIERLQHPLRVDLAFAVDGADLARFAAGRRA